MAKFALSTPELTVPVSEADPPQPRVRGLRERNKRDKLRRIVNAARELFEEKGFEATTAREICRRAEIGTGTLFLYVRDKHQLLILALRDDAEKLLAAGPRRLSPKGVVDSWVTFFGRLVDFYGRRPELARLFIRELSFRDHEFAEVAALTQKLRERVEDLARQAQETGELRSDVPLPEITNAVLSHWAFWVHLWLGSEAVVQRNVKKHLRRALELLFEGLKQR